MEEANRERLLADAKEFLESENWYARRGIPWKRGELEHLVYLVCVGSQVFVHAMLIWSCDPWSDHIAHQSRLASVPPLFHHGNPDRLYALGCCRDGQIFDHYRSRFRARSSCVHTPDRLKQYVGLHPFGGTPIRTCSVDTRDGGRRRSDGENETAQGGQAEWRRIWLGLSSSHAGAVPPRDADGSESNDDER